MVLQLVLGKKKGIIYMILDLQSGLAHIPVIWCKSHASYDVESTVFGYTLPHPRRNIQEGASIKHTKSISKQRTDHKKGF